MIDSILSCIFYFNFLFFFSFFEFVLEVGSTTTFDGTCSAATIHTTVAGRSMFVYGLGNIFLQFIKYYEKIAILF